jgi:hypothetical protein
MAHFSRKVCPLTRKFSFYNGEINYNGKEDLIIFPFLAADLRLSECAKQKKNRIAEERLIRLN